MSVAPALRCPASASASTAVCKPHLSLSSRSLPLPLRLRFANSPLRSPKVCAVLCSIVTSPFTVRLGSSAPHSAHPVAPLCSLSTKTAHVPGAGSLIGVYVSPSRCCLKRISFSIDDVVSVGSLHSSLSSTGDVPWVVVGSFPSSSGDVLRVSSLYSSLSSIGNVPWVGGSFASSIGLSSSRCYSVLCASPKSEAAPEYSMAPRDQNVGKRVFWPFLASLAGSTVLVISAACKGEEYVVCAIAFLTAGNQLLKRIVERKVGGKLGSILAIATLMVISLAVMYVPGGYAPDAVIRVARAVQLMLPNIVMLLDLYPTSL